MSAGIQDENKPLFRQEQYLYHHNVALFQGLILYLLNDRQ